MQMLKTSTALVLMMSLVSLAQAQKNSDNMYNLLIGTYSSEEKSGIYVYSFNSTTGAFTYKAEAGGIANPSYLAITKDQKHVYAVNEVGDGNGAVSAFSFEPSSGKLTLLNKSSAGGDAPCYVSVDDNNRFVFVGNYSGGSLAAIPVAPGGALSTDIQRIEHTGNSILKNQSKPHVHAVVLSKDNQYLFVPDLGTDRINIYRVDYGNAKPLTPADPAFFQVAAGGGPRHFTFDEAGKRAYLIQEMSGIVTAFSYTHGLLKETQSIALAPKGFSGKIDAADIHLSPDGKFLYGSLRGDLHEIVILSVDKGGTLKYVGRQSTLGKIPRNFAIDPTGNFLLVANQNSNDIIIFRRDLKTGLLQPTGGKITVERPVCLKFGLMH